MVSYLLRSASHLLRLISRQADQTSSRSHPIMFCHSTRCGFSCWRMCISERWCLFIIYPCTDVDRGSTPATTYNRLGSQSSMVCEMVVPPGYIQFLPPISVREILKFQTLVGTFLGGLMWKSLFSIFNLEAGTKGILSIISDSMTFVKACWQALLKRGIIKKISKMKYFNTERRRFSGNLAPARHWAVE